ncbi:ribonuclease [Collimonas fungivorans]|uniref:Putative Guanyl-specific ribonuclease St (RNase St) n=1 Tax=Collimonas fungivorans (strain Ter331) TaxID=1005048 RepID=G0AJC4_COLFT|nr:ribonuclease [Collimonas fungivorans]AEK61058.1 putative Guanyl-specific ribonuclease St (RNase St) [Collimonas fungivorans Ter331]
MKSHATRRHFPGLSSDFAAAIAVAVLRNGALLLLGLLLSFQVFARDSLSQDVVSIGQLPQEAQATLVLIKQGGPFPYAKDGVVFGNYEGMLPRQRRGYYHEFTVKTPRARNRGARRIIAGGNPQTSGEYYYTDDHYQTFRRIQE